MPIVAKGVPIVVFEMCRLSNVPFVIHSVNHAPLTSMRSLEAVEAVLRVKIYLPFKSDGHHYMNN